MPLTSISVRAATPDDIPAIQLIAYATWPVAYGEIISPQQMTYMLEVMYSTPALREQMEKKGHRFFLATRVGANGDTNDDLLAEAIAFASCELHYQSTTKAKIHKLYCLPTSQGTGVGRTLIDAMTTLAQSQSQTELTLNVNKHNKAQQFYQRLGFAVVAEEVINIGQGFLMDDFVMERLLT